MQRLSILGLPVVVPSDFMGMALMTYPLSGADPTGIINYGAVRMMFTPGTRWSDIETSAGVYSEAALADVDALITFQRTYGKTVIWGHDGTPLFYAQTAANPVVGDDVTKDPYGNLGGASYPTSLAAVTDYVSMMIQRYNKPGGAWYDVHGATLGAGIQRWETGNEPPLDALGNRATAPGQTTTSINFWGTVGQLTDYVQTQYAAIKAVDPSVTVLSPGLSNHAENDEFRKYMESVGTITGKTGAESCDALAWHPYFAGPPGIKYGVWMYPWLGDMMTGPLGAARVGKWLKDEGYPHAMHMTEWGMDTASSTDTTTAWIAKAADFRYNWICRSFMCAAAGGAASIHPWHWGMTGATIISGDWQNDTDGAQRAYNDCAARLSGKTIVSGTYEVNGVVSLTFSDGSTWTV